MAAEPTFPTVRFMESMPEAYGPVPQMVVPNGAQADLRAGGLKYLALSALSRKRNHESDIRTDAAMHMLCNCQSAFAGCPQCGGWLT